MRRALPLVLPLLLLLGACKKSSTPSDGDEPRKKSHAEKSVADDDDEPSKPKIPADAVTLDAINVSVETPYGASGYYVKVALDATLNKKLPAKYVLGARFACKVGGKKLVQDVVAMGVVEKLKPGETKRSDITSWFVKPLESAPKSCEIVFSIERSSATDATEIETVCWDGRKTNEGACES